MKRLLNILLIIPLLISCKSKNEVEFSMDPVTNIEALWQIIDTKYCYVEQKGVDWNAIHDDYIAKAKNIAVIAEANIPVELGLSEIDLCIIISNFIPHGMMHILLILILIYKNYI